MGEAVDAVARAYDRDAVMVTDVGQQQMFAARYFGFRRSRSVVTYGRSGNHGVRPPGRHRRQAGRSRPRGRPLRGDGGLQMTIQELATIFQSHVCVKIVLLNNSFLGMVRQWQELFYDRPLLVDRDGQPRFRVDRPRQRNRIPLRRAARGAAAGRRRHEGPCGRLSARMRGRKRGKRLPEGSGRRSGLGHPARITTTVWNRNTSSPSFRRTRWVC